MIDAIAIHKHLLSIAVEVDKYLQFCLHTVALTLDLFTSYLKEICLLTITVDTNNNLYLSHKLESKLVCVFVCNILMTQTILM